jgi:hypothetical protein
VPPAGTGDESACCRPAVLHRETHNSAFAFYIEKRAHPDSAHDSASEFHRKLDYDSFYHIHRICTLCYSIERGAIYKLRELWYNEIRRGVSVFMNAESANTLCSPLSLDIMIIVSRLVDLYTVTALCLSIELRPHFFMYISHGIDIMILSNGE